MENSRKYAFWIYYILCFLPSLYSLEISISRTNAEITLSAAAVFLNHEHTMRFKLFAYSVDANLPADNAGIHFTVKAGFCQSGTGVSPLIGDCFIAHVPSTIDDSSQRFLHSAYQINNEYEISGQAQLIVTNAENCEKISHLCVTIEGPKTGGFANDISCVTTGHVCTEDWVDVSAAGLRFEDLWINSGEATDVRAFANIIISNGGQPVNYGVSMYISTDTNIDPNNDKRILKLPQSFKKLDDLPQTSIEVDISGYGLKIPDLVINPGDQKYCTHVYIGIILDDGGSIPEPNEWNNQMVTNVTILCPGDSFSVSDFSFNPGYGQPNLVATYEIPVWINITVQIDRYDHSPVLPNVANFEIELYIHDRLDTFIDHDTGWVNSTAFKISRPGLEYNGVFDSREGRATGEYITFENLKVMVNTDDVNARIYGDRLDESNVFVFVREPSNSDRVEVVLQNNMQYQKLRVVESGTYEDVYWTNLDNIIWPEKLTENDTLSASNFTGFVRSTIPSLIRLYWSIDDVYDASDIDSGVDFDVIIGNPYTVRPVTPPQSFRAPDQSQFCGRIYGIWLHRPNSPNSVDAVIHNDVYIRRIIIMCHSDDVLAVTELKVLNPPVMWENVLTDFTFTVMTSCVAESCEGYRTNLHQSLYVYIDGPSPSRTAVPQIAYDYGNFDNRTFTASYSVSLIGATNRFVVEIDFISVDPYTDNNRLVFDLPSIIQGPFASVDVSAVSLETTQNSVELNRENAFSVRADLLLPSPLPANSSIPHFTFDIYLSEDVNFSPDDYRVNYRMTDALRDALTVELDTNFTFSDPVGFSLPEESLERFCPSKMVYVCAYMDSTDEDFDDGVAGKLNEIREDNNFGCTATAKALDTAGLIDCGLKQADPQPILTLSILDNVAISVSGVGVSALFIGSTLSFDVGITNHHSEILMGNGSLPGNWELELIFPGPLYGNISTDLSQQKMSAIGAGETLRFNIETLITASDICSEYEPSGILLTLRLQLINGEDTADYSTPADYSTTLPLACQDTFGVTFTFVRDDFDIIEDGAATSTYAIPFEVTLVNYFTAFTNLIIGGTAPYYDLTVDFTSDSCSAVSLSAVTFMVPETPQLEIDIGDSRTFRITAQLDVNAALCTCLDARTNNKITVTVTPSTNIPSYIPSHYEAAMPSSINFYCSASSIIDLVLDSSSTVIQAQQSLGDSSAYGSVSVTVTPDSDYVLQFIFSADDNVDGGDQVLAEFTGTAGATFTPNTNQVPLNSYMAGRFCNVMNLYLIVHVTLADSVSDPDVNLLDNTFYAPISFYCPGDIYRLEAVEGLDVTLVPAVNKLRFGVTVINVRLDNQTIPAGLRHAPNIYFELQHEDQTDPGYWWTWADVQVISSHQSLLSDVSLPIGTPLQIILEASEGISTTQCNDVITATGKMRVRLYQSTGLGADYHDVVPQDDYLEIDCSCGSAYSDLYIDTFTWDFGPTFDITIGATPVDPSSGLIFLALYLSYIDDPQEEPLLFHVSALNMPVDLSLTSEAISLYDDDLFYKFCGKAYVLALIVIDDDDIINDPDWSNNLQEFPIDIDCDARFPDDVKDLYALRDLSVQVQTGFLEDRQALLTFGVQVWNLGTEDILAGSDILRFKVSVKRGLEFHLDKLIDVTPEWTFLSHEQSKLTEAHAVDSAKVFSRIQGNVTIPQVLCDIGVDAMFISVEYPADKHKESVLQNNYEGFPITCVQVDSSIDLYPRPDRAGGHRFRFTHKNVLLLGEPQEFLFEVYNNVTGQGASAWDPPPSDNLPIFLYEFTLLPPVTSELSPQKVPHDVNMTEVNRPLLSNESTIFILGGLMTLSTDAFLDFCGLTNVTLKVTIDSNDDIVEADEHNNEAFIYGLSIFQDESLSCDPAYFTYGISEFSLLPQGRAEASYVPGSPTPLLLRFTLIYRALQATSNPSSSVDILLLLRGSKDNPGTTGDRKTLSGLIWSPVNTGASGYTYEVEVTIGPVEARAGTGYNIKPSMTDESLAVYCSRLPYLGVMVDPDGSKPSGYELARIAWTQIRLVCPYEDGFALTRFTVAPQILDASTPTTDFSAQVAVLNKGSEVSLLTLSFTVTLESMTDSVTVSTSPYNELVNGDWYRGETRYFTLSPVQLQIDSNCRNYEDVDAICISVTQPLLPDSDLTDNVQCTPLVRGQLDIDCARDISINSLYISVPPTVIFTKEVPVRVVFNVTMGFTGRALTATEDEQGHFDLDFHVRSDSNCNPDTDAVINTPAVTDLYTKRTQEILNGTELSLSGRTTITVPESSCNYGAEHFICVSYVYRPNPMLTLPMFRDDDTMNNCGCFNMSARFFCGPLVDIEPRYFELMNPIVQLDEELRFFLEVRVEKINLPVIFQSKFYLSADAELGGPDVELFYDDFYYGESKQQMHRPMQPGVHTLNLGGHSLVIPSTAINSQDLCGSLFLLYHADSDNAWPEKDEMNNVLSTPIIISCMNQIPSLPGVNDQIELLDFWLDVEEPLFSSRDSILYISFELINVGSDLGLPSYRTPLYDVALYSDAGHTLLGTTDTIEMPIEFTQPMPRGTRHKARRSEVEIHAHVWTKELCEATNYITICIIANGDTLQNGCLNDDLDPDMKICQSTLHDRDISLSAASVPTLLNLDTDLTVIVRMDFTMAPYSIPINPRDFRSAVVLSRRSEFDFDMTYLVYRTEQPVPLVDAVILAELINSAEVLPGEKKRITERFEAVRISASPDSSYCGLQFMHVIADFGRDILESIETNNIITKRVRILCPQDIWSIAPPELSTSENMLIEGVEVPYTMKIHVGCMHDIYCVLPRATENIMISVTYTNVNGTLPPVPGFNITHSYVGDVRPALGIPFNTRGKIREFDVSGLMILPVDLCEAGMVAILVEVYPGQDALPVTELLTDNNRYKVIYPCSKGLNVELEDIRDILAYPIEILGGQRFSSDTFGPSAHLPVLTTGRRNVFQLQIGIRGPPIAHQDGSAPTAPFSYSLSLSKDKFLDDKDRKLNYVMSAGVSSVLTSLPADEELTVVTQDFVNGFRVPPGVCGRYSVIIHLDDTHRIAESSETNNMAATDVFIHCPNNAMALTGLELHQTSPLRPGSEYNCTAEVNITNLALFDFQSNNEPAAFFRAYLSDDPLLDVALTDNSPGDKWVQVDNIAEDLVSRLKVLIHPGEEVNINLNVSNVSLTVEECQSMEYIIVELVPVRNGRETDTDRSDNYMAYPILTECTGSVDIEAMNLTTTGELIGKTTWTSASLRPVDYTYRLWASHDETLDDNIDANIILNGVHTIISASGTEESILSAINMDLIPTQYCGELYLIAQLDVFNDIPELDETNNDIVVKTFKICPDDTMTFNIRRINMDMPSCEDTTFSVPLEFFVHCFNAVRCTNVPVTTNTNNFYFTVKILDGNLIHVADVSPSQLDQTTMPNPSFVKEALLNNPLTIQQALTFTVLNTTQCEEFQFMQWEIFTGTSPSMSLVDIGPRESKIRMVPLTFSGEPRSVDVSVSILRGGSIEGEVNVSAEVFDLHLEVFINAQNWDVNYNEKAAFSYILGVQSSEYNIKDLGYSPSPSVLSKLTGKLPSGQAIDLSEQTSRIKWDLLRLFCGFHGLELTVTIDPDERLDEIDETNNYEVASEPFTIVGCRNGFDLKIARFVLGDNDMVAGGQVDVDVDVHFLIIGPGLGLPEQTGGKKNYIIKFDLVDTCQNPTEVFELDYDLEGLDELSAMIVTEHESIDFNGVSFVITHTLSEMRPLTVPTDSVLCGRSWFLRVAALLETQVVGDETISHAKDRAPNDNFDCQEFRILCGEDKLSLWRITDLELPDEIWSDAYYEITMRLTIQVSGETGGPAIPASEGTDYLFEVKQYFSANSDWQSAYPITGWDVYTKGQSNPYRHTAGAEANSFIHSPRLTGTINIPKSKCQEAIAVTGKPAIFVQFLTGPADENYSPITENDILRIKIDKSRLQCKDANVDLRIESLLVSEGTGNVTVNEMTMLSFILRYHRTQTGSIPSSTDLSYDYLLFLNKDGRQGGDDRSLQVNYTREQLRNMRSGIGPNTPPFIDFTARNLLVDLDVDPLASYYCGACYLGVRVRDRKNSENIDPQLTNNYYLAPIYLQCPGDVLTLKDVSLTLTGRQKQFFPGVWTEFDFEGTVAYHPHEKQPASKSLIIFMFYLSEDPLFDPYIDPQMDVGSKIEDTDLGFDPNTERHYRCKVRIRAAQNSCKYKPQFILIFVTFGAGQIKDDPLILNNYQALNFSPIINCTLSTADLVVSQFELPAGNRLTPGIWTNFVINVTTQLREAAFLGSPLVERDGRHPRMFEFDFFLSQNEIPDYERDHRLYFDKSELDDRYLRWLNTFQTVNFYMVPENITLEIPPDLDPSYCGRSYLIYVVDPDKAILETDESNNAISLPVDVNCPSDKVSMFDVKLDLQPVYFQPTGGLQLSMTLLPLVIPLEPVRTLMCVRVDENSTCHDITPDQAWISITDVISFTGITSKTTYTNLENFISIREACNANKDPLITGINQLVFTLAIGTNESVPGLYDGKPSNNIHLEPINCDCSQTHIDIFFESFTLLTEDGLPTKHLQLGENYFRLGISVNTSDPAVYNGRIDRAEPVFTFRVTLVSTVKTFDGAEIISFDEIPMRIENDQINRPVTSYDVINYVAMDKELGINMTDKFWICLAQSLNLNLLIDSDHQLTETNEFNNRYSEIGLSLPPSLCNDQDLEVTTFGFRYVYFDLIKAETNLFYRLRVNTWLVGSKASINGLPSFIPIHHFQIWIFLSLDKELYLNASDVVLGMELSQDQIDALKKTYRGLSEIVLDGILNIPINATTYPFCWKKVNIGVYIDPENKFPEVDKTNNIKFVEAFLNCGTALDECKRGLDNCHEEAECMDHPYSMYDYHRGILVNPKREDDLPYFICKCSEGFTGNGTHCTNIDECSLVDDEGQPLHNCYDKENTKCVDQQGGYKCECADGYISKTDTATGDSSCEDIDECESQEAKDCHMEADCTNINGSYLCTCKPGFSGNGTICEDVNECISNPCKNDGTCYNDKDYPKCVCPEHTEGVFCEKVNGNWGSWGPWSSCYPSCGDNSKSSRIRGCNNPPPSQDGRPCEIHYGQGSRQTKKCPVRLCGAEDISTCEQSRCMKTGQCDVTMLGERLVCDPGYQEHTNGDGTRACIDINECVESEGVRRHTCDVMLGACINAAGTYNCTCPQGYEMRQETGNTCHDINECDKGTHRCDKNALCHDVSRDYLCHCKPGFKREKLGDPKTGVCLEERLLPYGKRVGDTLLTSESTLVHGERTSPLLYVAHGLPCFDGVLANAVYISENGLLVLTKDVIDTQRKNSYKFAQRLDTVQLKEDKAVALLAAFWSDTNFSPSSQVWYQIYYERDSKIHDKVEKIMEEEDTECPPMKLDFILKVTWHKMSPTYLTKDEENTFQAIILTDNIHACVVYIYDKGGMQWSPPYGPNMPEVEVGIYTPTMNYSAFYTNTTTPPTFEDIFRIGQSENDTGIRTYRIDENLPTFINPRRECIEWKKRQPSVLEPRVVRQAGSCPQFLGQAKNDMRFMEIYDRAVTCINNSLPLTNGVIVQCCYNPSGALRNHTPINSGRAKLDEIGIIIKSSDDYDAFDLCCNEAPDGRVDYCENFLEKRPQTSSDHYDQLVPAMIDGMGFYTTFDDHTNILPLYGEYLAARSRCLLLQTRHSYDRDKKDTVYVSAVGIKVSCVSESRIEIYSSNSTLNIMVDQVPWEPDMNFAGFSVQPTVDCNAGGVEIVFEDGTSILVTIRRVRLRVVLRVPRSRLDKDDFEGLFGDADGNPDNDDKPFTPQDDPQAGQDSIVSWELLRVYGVSAYAKNTGFYSLFSDYPNQGALHYHKRGQVLPQINPEDEELTAFRSYCLLDEANDPYLPCLLDLDNTGSNTDTLAHWECFLELAADLRYTPAVFLDAPESLVLRHRSADLGKPLYEMDIEYTVRAYHPNRVPLTFTPSIKDRRHFEILDSIEQIRQVTVEPDEMIYGAYKASFTYAINITYDPIFLSMTVSDGKASAVLIKKVIECHCENGGTCHIEHAPGPWTNAPCICPVGWTGSRCETEMNGCYREPCKSECRDNPSPSRYDVDYKEYRCEACPQEQTGDGSVCHDPNECMLDEDHELYHQCEQLCIDRANGYVCSCESGFTLNEDKFACDDVNECASANKVCDEVRGECTNEPGSYTCGCKEGFKLMPDNSCEDIDECLGDHDCQQLCINTEGSYDCSCLHGFNEHDRIYCRDIDECKEGNHGCDDKCVNTDGGYLCECPKRRFRLDESHCRCEPEPGYKCTERENICSHPEAFCSKINGNILCHCPQGYKLGVALLGKQSCVDVDECTANTHNCDVCADCVNRNGTYKCVCKAGYMFDLRSGSCNDVDECKAGSHNCEQRCVNVEGSFMCDCNSGFTLVADGRSCHNTDECMPGQYNDCHTRADCTSLPDGRYKCTCWEGFTGDGFHCTDIQSCYSDDNGCQMNCIETEGSHVCTCNVGFSPDPDDRFKCIDINECEIPESAARCTQICENSHTQHPAKNGNYKCSCYNNYELREDGKSCQAIHNACEDECGGGTCVEIRGVKTCSCYEGYAQFSFFENAPADTECTNINECRTLNFNQCNATTKAFCVDKVPGYRCVCETGYVLNPDQISCRDEDECLTGEKPVCNIVSSVCKNYEGSYECVCKEGFRKNSTSSKNCEDVDECSQRSLQGNNKCDDFAKADCLNLQGSFSCRCKPGYFGNGTKCYDVDECRDMKVCHKEREICVNDDGGYHCECRQGYQNISGQCENIDECRSPWLNMCERRAMCEDKPGSFICWCSDDEIPMFDGQIHRCIPRYQCTDEEKKLCKDASCKKVKEYQSTNAGPLEILSAICQCSAPRWFQNGFDCVDINECKVDDPCGKNTICKNVEPLFECKCIEPYLPSPDGLTCEETDGGWGLYTDFSKCDEDCAGVMVRTRECDSPPPVGWNRSCAGKAVDKQLCSKKDRANCRAKVPNKGCFMDIGGMLPEEFADCEKAILLAEVETLNEYFRQNNITLRKYCRKNRPNNKGRLLQISSLDLKTSGFYPRPHPFIDGATRYLRFVCLNRACLEVEMPDTPDYYIVKVRHILTNEDKTDFLPCQIYREAMAAIDARNNSVFLENLKEKLYDARKNWELDLANFSYLNGNDEDVVKTTAVVVVTDAPEVVPYWGIAIIVAVGCVLIIVVVSFVVFKIISKKDKKMEDLSAEQKKMQQMKAAKGVV